ncbi:MAG TPA: formyltetrahydrofolate deformylase [Acidimicrobiales bacterium]
MADQKPVQRVITLACPDQIGIVHSVSGLLAGAGWNIDDSQQFADTRTNRFFMRVVTSNAADSDELGLEDGLGELASRFNMEVTSHSPLETPPVLVLVSKLGHCLNDLLYRQSIGALSGKIAGVVSNHPDFEALVGAYGIPFHYLPVSDENRREQETTICDLADSLGVALVILARYMQILSPEMVSRLDGRAINIHHSFLPGFKGGRPYHQAYERGVKLIGATAHYVTSELDEGPIIEQEVVRVDHRANPNELTAIGRDVECVALARAVEAHLSHRVMMNGNRTVVFH